MSVVGLAVAATRWVERTMAAAPAAPGALMILVAGPYRSGTDDDPMRIAANVAAMNEAALALFRQGHLPMTGEGMALPLIDAAGSRRIGDAPFHAIFHPYAEMLARRCDGCLRIGGASAGADRMVRIVRALHRPVWFRLEDVPSPR